MGFQNPPSSGLWNQGPPDPGFGIPAPQNRLPNQGAQNSGSGISAHRPPPQIQNPQPSRSRLWNEPSPTQSRLQNPRSLRSRRRNSGSRLAIRAGSQQPFAEILKNLAPNSGAELGWRRKGGGIGEWGRDGGWGRERGQGLAGPSRARGFLAHRPHPPPPKQAAISH